MRVFFHPTGLHSRAMTRVANALAQYTPPGIQLSGFCSPPHCDLQILHVINQDAIPYARDILARGGKYAVIQYCFRTAGGDLRDWLEMWRGAEVVWSYLEDVKVLSRWLPYANPADLERSGLKFVNREEDFKMYYAPLGVDEVFRSCSRSLDSPVNWARRNRVITSGYVTGPGAEPIREVWEAARMAGMEAIHIGPWDVEGMGKKPLGWQALQNLTDEQLANVYSASAWVSGLRHVEGFELPAAEGLVCGARPIVFDQPGMREWYHGHAVFVEEASGEELVQRLVNRFQSVLPEVTAKEREDALARFDWERIAKGFWEALLR